MSERNAVVNPELAKRLLRALKRKEMSARSLAERLQADLGKSTRGTSYAGVRALVAGEIRRPRLEVLRAAAGILDVRPEWLAAADGPMTDEEERARLAQEATAKEAPEAVKKAREAIRPPDPVLVWGPFCAEWKRIPGFELSMLFHALEKWRGAKAAGWLREDAHAIDNPVGKVFDATLKTLGIEPSVLSNGQLQRYARDLALALLDVIPTTAPQSGSITAAEPEPAE